MPGGGVAGIMQSLTRRGRLFTSAGLEIGLRSTTTAASHVRKHDVELQGPSRKTRVLTRRCVRPLLLDRKHGFHSAKCSMFFCDRGGTHLWLGIQLAQEASDLIDCALRGLRYLDWVEARQRHFGVAWTHGIRVETTTQFLLRMDDGDLLFAYRVRVSNHSDRQRQLVGRYLRFTNSAGGVIEVPRGSPGVVGHTPILAPDQCFEYVSGCTQEAEHGTMLGSFQMIDGVCSSVRCFHSLGHFFVELELLLIHFVSGGCCDSFHAGAFRCRLAHGGAV